MKFSIKHFFSKYDQIRSFLQIWLHLLKKSLMENFIFYAVIYGYGYQSQGENAFHNLLKFYLGLKSPNTSFTENGGDENIPSCSFMYLVTKSMCTYYTTNLWNTHPLSPRNIFLQLPTHSTIIAIKLLF